MIIRLPKLLELLNIAIAKVMNALMKSALKSEYSSIKMICHHHQLNHFSSDSIFQFYEMNDPMDQR